MWRSLGISAGSVLLTGACALGCGATATESEDPSSVSPSATADETSRCAVEHSPGTEELAEGLRAAQAGDYEQAQRLFALSCDSGNPCACTEMGTLFVDPPNASIERDAERGATLLERACEGGDVWGCYTLGSAIWRFLPDRATHAQDLYDDACDDGLAEACSELGRLRATGLEGDRSAREAMRLYDRACREGVHHACVMLGEAYSEGIGTAPDPGRAAELLTWACDEAGRADACGAWADSLEPNDPQREPLLRRACDGGDREACDQLAPGADRIGGERALAAIATSAPETRALANGTQQVDVQIDGAIDLSELGLRPSCVGFVGAAPSAVLTVPEGATHVRFRVSAPTDTVLAIRDPDGRWLCADDGSAGAYDPSIAIESPPVGDYRVWAGTLERTSLAGRVVVDAVAPEPPPIVTYESLPEPTSETATIPRRRMRFYQLEVTTMPGLRGRVRVDGEELWAFGPEGGRAVLDRIQCLMAAGRHTLDVDVVQRATGARVTAGEGGLVHVVLSGSDQPGLLGQESRLFAVDWSPDAPSRHRIAFTLTRNHAATRAAACDQVASTQSAE